MRLLVRQARVQWRRLGIALTLFLAACGSTPDAVRQSGFSSGTVAQQVTVTATGGVTWEPAQLTVTAGEVTFSVKNPTTLNHNFNLSGNGVDARSGTIKPRANVDLTYKGLPSGTYKFICTIPGHEATMIGTRTVK